MTVAPNVNFTRQEVEDLAPQWGLIRDCLAGETVVKKRGQTYLPHPTPDDVTPAGNARYAAYLTRAVFYNVTKRTLSGLTGQIFSRTPIIELPGTLEMLRKDATGGGVDLEQLAKQSANLVISHGRAGVLADYPRTAGGLTVAEAERGNIRPMLHVYDPWDIINWRTMQRGGRTILSLVVLRETYVIEDDGFETKDAYQWRVLRLEDDVYTVTIYRSGNSLIPKNDPIPILKSAGTSFEIVEGPFTPTDANGSPLDEIPFTFIGSEDNEEYPDDPPMYDLASLNMAHYRNSADYEEAVFIVGQPTPYATGLTEEWVNKILNRKLPFGSRAGILLPRDSQAGLLQPEPNSMAFEALEHKERQMVALGAKLVEQRTVQRTARESDIENASETSTLANSAKNVSAAFTRALEFAQRFTGGGGKIEFKLNTEFDLIKLTPEERRQLISEWQGNAITFSEMREALRRAGIATLPDEEARQEIEGDAQRELELDRKRLVMETEALGGNDSDEGE